MLKTISTVDKVIFRDSIKFKEIRQWSDKSFKDHKVQVIYNNDKYKKFCFSRPNSWAYGFYVTQADQFTLVHGDIDTGIWQTSLNNLKEYFLSNDDYAIEKYWLRDIPKTSFSYEKVIKLCDEEIKNSTENKKQWMKIKRMANDRDCEYEINMEIHEVTAGDDFPDVEDFTYQFVWCVLGMERFFKEAVI